MADITKCTGLGCDKSDSCYRVQAKSSERQSMFIGLPNNEDGTCNYFWDLQTKEIKED
jgi:hypothetical protein